MRGLIHVDSFQGREHARPTLFDHYSYYSIIAWAHWQKPTSALVMTSLHCLKLVLQQEVQQVSEGESDCAREVVQLSLPSSQGVTWCTTSGSMWSLESVRS